MNKLVVKAALVFMLVGLVLGGIIGYGLFGRGKATYYDTLCDTTTYVDTITYYQPVPKDSVVVRYVTRTLPVIMTTKTYTFFDENYAQNNGENIPPQEMSDERDSMAVEIPITQKRYDGENYSAWVSGYEPSLDSIFVSQRTDVVTIREKKPPNKWHIGVQCGVGYTFKSKQFEPFIGVGLSYSIISF